MSKEGVNDSHICRAFIFVTFIGYLLSGCSRYDPGNYLLSLQATSPGSNRAIVLQGNNNKVIPICDERRNNVAGRSCIYATSRDTALSLLALVHSGEGDQSSTELQLWHCCSSEPIVVSRGLVGYPGTGSVSPDGRSVIFTFAPKDSPRSYDLWIWSLDRPLPEKLDAGVNVEKGWCIYPKWSPDAKSVVYIYATLGKRKVRTELHTFDLVKREDHKLLHGMPVAGAVYSPSIANLIAAWTGNGLEIVDSDKGTSRLLVPQRWLDHRAFQTNSIAWSSSPDSITFAVLNSGTSEVYNLNLRTSKLRKIYTFPNAKVIELDSISQKR